MTEKLSKEKRDYLKRLVKETILWRYTTVEALNYITQKLGVSISERYYFDVKAKVTEENKEKQQYFEDNRGTIFIEEYMMRIMEMENYQRDTWQLIRKHEDNPAFQLQCYRQLHQLTMTLAELYVNLPDAFGFSKDLQNKIDSRNRNDRLVRRDNKIHFTDSEREGLDSSEAKF